MKRRHLDLLNGPIVKTLLLLSLPLMAGAFTQMAYNLTDIFFIGKLGVNAVAATGTMGYFMWMGESLNATPRSGVSVFVAQAYGAKKFHEATENIADGWQLSMTISLIYASLLFFAIRPLLAVFRLEPVVVDYAVQYSQVIALGLPFAFSAPILSAAFNSIGDSQTPFRMNLVGLVANLILNPILIYGVGLIPAMGVFGAALATSLAKSLVALGLFYSAFKHEALLSHVPWFKKPALSQWPKFLKLGIPTSLLGLFHTMTNMYLNRLVANFGSAAVAVLSTGSQLESLTWLSAEGLSFGLTAFIGQNVGAKQWERVKLSIKKGLFIVMTITFTSGLILFLGRYEFFRLLIPHDEQVVSMGAMYLTIISICQVFQGLEIGATGVFHGLGETRIPSSVSSILNLSRLPISWILIPYFGVNGIWVAISVTCILKGIINVMFLKAYSKKTLYLNQTV